VCETLTRDLIAAPDPSDNGVDQEAGMKRTLGALLAAALIVHTTAIYAAPARVGASDQHPVGSLREAARQEGARLATMPQARSSAQPLPQNKNWVARHPVLFGALAGAGVGLGFAAASDCQSSSDYTCTGIALFFAGTGAGLGAAGGLVVSLFQR